MPGLRRLCEAGAISALFAVAGCAAPKTADCNLALVADLKLGTNGDAFTIPVVINRQKAALLLDTGGPNSLLTSAWLYRLSLRSEHLLDDLDVPEGFAIDGVGGRRHIDRFTSSTLDIGPVHLNGIAFSVLRPQPGESAEDGLLGMDLLTGFDMDLDTARRRLVLYRASGQCAAPMVAMAPPLHTAPLLPTPLRAGPMVLVHIGAHDFVALIDTGAQRTTLFATAAKTLGLNYADLPKGGRYFANGVGSTRVHAGTATLPSMAIGSLALTDVSVGIVNEIGPGRADLVLGTDFLTHVHSWISHSSHTLVMRLADPASLAPVTTGQAHVPPAT